MSASWLGAYAIVTPEDIPAFACCQSTGAVFKGKPDPMARRPLLSVVAFSSGQGLALVLGLTLQTMVARRLFPADYGRFVVANTIQLALTLALVSAVPKSLARIVSVDRQQLQRAWQAVGRVQLPICVTVAAIVWGVAALAGASGLMEDDGLRLALQLVTIELIIRAGVLEPAWHLLNGLHRHFTQAGLMLAHSLFRVVCVWLCLRLDAGLQGCILALAGASLASLVFVLPVMTRIRRSSEDPDHTVRGGSVKAELMKWLQFAPVAEILNYLVVASNLWLLKLISDDSVGIGIYAACFMLSQAVMPFGVAVSRGLFAAYAAMFEQKRLEDAASLLRLVLRCAFVSGSCAISVALVLGSSIVSVCYGSDYDSSGPLFGMLIAGTFGVTIVWILGDVLNAAGHLQTRLLSMTVTAIIAAAAGVGLIMGYGIMGAAVAMLLTGIAGAVLFCRAIAHHIPGSIPVSTVFRSIMAAVVTVLVCRQVLVADSAAALAAGAGFVIFVNLCCTAVLREWSRADVDHVISALRWKFFQSNQQAEIRNAPVSIAQNDMKGTG